MSKNRDALEYEATSLRAIAMETSGHRIDLCLAAASLIEEIAESSLRVTERRVDLCRSLRSHVAAVVGEIEESEAATLSEIARLSTEADSATLRAEAAEVSAASRDHPWLSDDAFDFKTAIDALESEQTAVLRRSRAIQWELRDTEKLPAEERSERESALRAEGASLDKRRDVISDRIGVMVYLDKLPNAVARRDEWNLRRYGKLDWNS